MAQLDRDAVVLQLGEGVAELAAVPHRDHVAILTLGDREAEGERTGRAVAVALAERGGGQDLALAVGDGDLGVRADVGVTVRSRARRVVRGDGAEPRCVGQHESP